MTAPTPNAADLAEHIIQAVDNQFNLSICPDEQAELDAILEALEKAEPSLTRSGPTHPYVRLSDAITRLWVATHTAGIRDGAAAAEVLHAGRINRTSRKPPPVSGAAIDEHTSINDPNPWSEHIDDVDARTQLDLLHDPLRFAEVMTEHLFYRVFDALFLTDGAPAYARFVGLVKTVTHAQPGPRLTAALHDLEEERYNTAGLLIADMGIPMGVALEHTRQTLIACLDRIQRGNPNERLTTPRAA